MVNSRVGRYWPGKAPKYSNETTTEDSDNADDEGSENQPSKLQTQTNASRIRIQLHEKDGQQPESPRDNEEESNQRLEDLQQSMEAESDPEEDPDSRRARIRERLQQRQEEEMIKEFQEEEEEEEEEESESEYETDSEEEFGKFPVLAPVFVSKQERETILERERQQEEEERKEREKEAQLEERRKETKNLLIEELTRQQNQAQENKGNIAEIEVEDVDTSEGSEDEQSAEFEKWKIRELLRIKREREERDKQEKEQELLEKRRQLTDAEIKELDKELLKPKQKPKWKFLQKYYHKGAFFQDADDEIYQRDVSAPTGEDRFDKTLLPDVMRVKNFGRAGRTKYTHLVDQDTTNWDSPWVLADHLRAKYTAKMGGMGATDQNAIPRKRKRTTQDEK